MKVLKSTRDQLAAPLIAKINSGDFFNSLGWFDNFIDTVTKPSATEAFFFHSDEDVPVVLPAMVVADNSAKVLKSLTNYYSPLFSMGGQGSVKNKTLWADFFREIRRILPDWDLLEIRPVAYEEAQELQAQLKTAGIPAVSFFCFGNWYMEVNGRTFKEYFNSLPSVLKNTANRKAKKFFQLEGARVEIVATAENLPAAIAAYDSVYQSSWKVPEPYPEFMPGLIHLAAKVNGLRLGIAYLGDKAIAAQVWIVADNSAYIFKLAYDEEYKSYSAGTILTTRLMEHVIDVDKVAVIDYLCGDDAYKKDWMSHRRERWGVLAFNTATVKGCVEYARETVKFCIKRFKAKLSVTATENP